MKNMTGKGRLKAAITGQPVDRVPIWLKTGFPVCDFMHDADDFSYGWQAGPIFQKLYMDVEPYVDALNAWHIGRWYNLLAPAQCFSQTETHTSPDCKRTEGSIELAGGKRLTFVSEKRRGLSTEWDIKKPAAAIGDIAKMLEMPFAIRPSDLDACVADFRRQYRTIGDRGLMVLQLGSIPARISSCMDFEMFLELSLTEKFFFHNVMRELTRRALMVIDALFKDRPLDTICIFVSSEQCTPPMMNPRAYGEFVVPYDGQIVRRLKEYGVLSSCHCHGKVRDALPRMIDMGFVATDPVEPPPQGNVTFAEARAIVGDKLTLVGNIESVELCTAEPAYIRERVKEILHTGKERLILAPSDGLYSAMDQKMADNYRAWIETAVEFG